MLTKNGTVKLEEGQHGSNFLYKIKTKRKPFKISFFDVVYARLLIDEHQAKNAKVTAEVSEAAWAFMGSFLLSDKNKLEKTLAASKQTVHLLLYSHNNSIIPDKLRKE